MSKYTVIPVLQWSKINVHPDPQYLVSIKDGTSSQLKFQTCQCEWCWYILVNDNFVQNVFIAIHSV
jgi:hypothetical protein